MPSVTQLVQQAQQGNAAAVTQLMPLVYDELRALAQHMLADERRDHSLGATAIVHEAYLRLVDQSGVDWQGRVHFFAIAARMLRRVLVDHARAKHAEKRGGDARRLNLRESVALLDEPAQPFDLLDVDDSLRGLEALNARHARMVELRFFAGLNVEETALALGVSTRTVEEDWRFARAWLRARLGGIS